MAGYCLSKLAADSLTTVFKTGKMTAQKLIDMGTEGRNKFFSDYVGPDIAKLLNTDFESKLVLKDVKAGLQRFYNSLEKDPTLQASMAEKISKLDEKILNPADQKAFLQDLAEKKLGVKVNDVQAATISKLSTTASESKAALDASLAKAGIEKFSTGPDYPPEVQDAAIKSAASEAVLNSYINGLKNDIKNLTFKQRLNPKNTFRNIGDVVQTTKSLVYSLNPHGLFKHALPSLFNGKASWRTMFINPDWLSALAKQYRDGWNTLIHNTNTEMDTAVAINSSRNAVNGLYSLWDKNILKQQEEFKATGLGKTPLGIGRLWRASKAMFDNPLTYIRAKMIDHYINVVTEMGLDPYDKQVAKEWGAIAIRQTGGESAQGGGESIASKVFSSERLIKSQAQFLTANTFSKDSLPIRIENAKNLAKQAVGMSVLVATIGAIAKASGFNMSVGINPLQSSKFMHLKAGPISFDLSGGYSGYISYLARQITGEYVTTTGKVDNLSSGKYGALTRLAVTESFVQGKLSPVFSTIASWMAGQDWAGNKPSIGNSAANLFGPIALQNSFNAKNAGLSASDRALLFTGEAVIGILASVTSPPSVATTTAAFGNVPVNSTVVKELDRLQLAGQKPTLTDITTDPTWTKLKVQVGPTQFNQVTQVFRQDWSSRLNATINTPQYKSESDLQKKTDLNQQRRYAQSQAILQVFGKKTITDILPKAPPAQTEAKKAHLAWLKKL